MKSVNEYLPANQKWTGHSESQQQRSTTQIRFNHDKSVFRQVWAGLQAAGHIGKHEQADGGLYRYWRTSLKDLSNTDLMKGLDKANNFPDYMNLGRFAEFCQPEVHAPYHQPFQALPKPKMTVDQRKAAMAKLRAEVGI